MRCLVNGHPQLTERPCVQFSRSWIADSDRLLVRLVQSAKFLLAANVGRCQQHSQAELILAAFGIIVHGFGAGAEALDIFPSTG